MCPQACSAGTLPTLAQIKAQMLALDYEHQPDALLTQVNPVQNTWYTVLNTTPNARIISIMMQVSVANETVECRLTIDGNVFIGSQAMVFNTAYFIAFVAWSADSLHFDLNDYTQNKPFFVEGKSIMIEMRKTTNAGNGNLIAIVKYAKRV